MDQETLKKLRLFVPGCISVILGSYYYSILTGSDFSDFKIEEYSVPFLIAVVVGTFYYLFEVRNIVTGYSHKRIDLNIKNNIIKLYPGNLTDEQLQFLFQKNRLKDIFYKIVDNDESLKTKAKNVYFNGLIWTSTADYFIISLVFAVAFLVTIPFDPNKKNELLIGAFLTVSSGFIFLGLHVLSVLRHIQLSNEQIEYIETHHIITVKTNVENVLHQLPQA